MYQIGSFINGKLIKGSSNNTLPVYNPSTGEIQSEVILTPTLETFGASNNFLASRTASYFS